MVVGASGAAEEVTQDAFVRVYRRWNSLDAPDAFLRTVTMNLCRSHLRHRKVELRHPPDATRVSVAAPELDETWLAVSRLPFRQRAVLALRYYADLPEVEIASLLGCRIGTVKSARHRALAALRKELS
jgi:RNA polymerase sigma factor (sigma-70 family)